MANTMITFDKSGNMARVVTRRLRREAIKLCLSPLLRWTPLENPKPGFSIVLGVPWILRHLLALNLRFVARTNLEQLRCIHIIFDRPPQADGQAFIDQIKAEYDALPMNFLFHPPFAGRLVQRVNRSKFFASTNWTLGLKACQTRYAILHDFDLYPLEPEFFVKIVEFMRERDLRFSGIEEYAAVDGLTSYDGLLRTWELGVDVAWLRDHYRPINCFHAITRLNGREVDLDAFHLIQAKTPQRALTPGVDNHCYAHVVNLCSTYLKYSQNQMTREGERLGWRLHLLWYLESLAGHDDRLDVATSAMQSADSATLLIDGRQTNFADVHVSCAAVLRRKVIQLEEALFGTSRVQVEQFLEATDTFLHRYGSSKSLSDLEEPLPDA